VGQTSLYAQGATSASHPVGTLLVDGIGSQPSSIYSFGIGVSHPVTVGSGGGSGAGNPQVTNVQVTRLSDALSPQLFRAAVLGVHIASVDITIAKTGAAAASLYTLEDAVITGLATSDALEQMSFAFARVRLSVGNATTCYDVASNSSC
jgi:type VI protein secretion system component Hcp